MANCSAREAAIRASDLAFRRLRGREYLYAEPYDLIGPRQIMPRPHIFLINPEEAENAKLEDDDDEDEAEERTGDPGDTAAGKIRTSRHVLASAGR